MVYGRKFRVHLVLQEVRMGTRPPANWQSISIVAWLPILRPLKPAPLNAGQILLRPAHGLGSDMERFDICKVTVTWFLSSKHVDLHQNIEPMSSLNAALPSLLFKVAHIRYGSIRQQRWHNMMGLGCGSAAITQAGQVFTRGPC